MSENDSKEADVPPAAADAGGSQTKLERAAAASVSRDVPLSTFVHLLGLSTATQVTLLESKVDVMSSKLATALLKLERLVADVTEIKGDAAVDRIDFQLNDIRTLLKKMAPSIVTGSAGASAAADGESKSPASRAKVLKSESAKGETKIVENDNLADMSKAADNEAFQAAEMARIRNQTKEGA